VIRHGSARVMVYSEADALPIGWLQRRFACYDSASYGGEMKTIEKLMAGAGVLAFLFCASALALLGRQKSVSVEGYVLDSACAFTKNLEKPISRECALKCAKAGSQLVILGDDGSIYWPIADTMPATGQNARLLEYAGGRVTVKGKLYDRGGSHALVIEQIAAAPAKK
jgi:hypothetical protein